MTPVIELEKAAWSRQKAIDAVIDEGDSEIQRFYSNSVILITGSTGFLGKHLLYKLLRSCNIKKVYVLLRHKKNKAPHDRIHEIFNDKLFEELFKIKPDIINRVEVIQGDISELDLAISSTDFDRIIKEVEIIIHSAAIVNFSAPLQEAVINNVRGTREMLKLAKACNKLRSFVHISTAYTHSTRDRSGQPVLEEFYQSPMSPKTIIKFAEGKTIYNLNDLSTVLLRDWPNTYTYTKAIAEELVRTIGKDLPICIVRPSTVLSAYTEPRPGWIDKSNLNGPSGLLQGVKMGLIHVIPAKSEIAIDYIPADYVNNAVIAAAWDATTRNRVTEEPKIYTICSTRNRRSWGENSDVLYPSTIGTIPSQAKWYAFVFNIRNKFLFYTLAWILQIIPGYIADIFGLLLGKQMKISTVYAKISRLSEVMSFFTQHQWFFGDDNVQKLYEKMSPKDKVIYNFNILDVDWNEMMILWALGLRIYINQDDLNTTVYAMKKQYWFKIATFILTAFYIFLFYLSFLYVYRLL